MSRAFSSFVVLAEMRTGSNFLEENLRLLDGVDCHGELFNPHFIGWYDRHEFLGLDKAARDADPLGMLARMRAQEGLHGFRFFHDHDPRVLAHVLADPACAKIVLTRNPLDAHVSRRIAAATGQWRLGNVKHLRQARVPFDPAAFEAELEAHQAHQLHILHALQTSGQAAFYIGYDDLFDIDVLNGLAAFLGVPARLEALSQKLKKQNPEPVTEKVANPGEMVAALARMDRFDLSRTPNFEPRRGPSLPAFRAAPRTALLFQPLRGAPGGEVLDWLAALDGAQRSAIREGFDQRSLRAWQEEHPGHRAFTVLRHPLPRAWWAFDTLILSGRFRGIRDQLRRNHAMALPDPKARDGYGLPDLRADFLAFLRFLRQNLAGQTAVRVDAAWASQGAQLRGFAQVRLPDRLLREADWAEELAALAGAMGHDTTPPPPPIPDWPDLAAIHDEELEDAARSALAGDFAEFGFGRWRG